VPLLDIKLYFPHVFVFISGCLPYSSQNSSLLFEVQRTNFHKFFQCLDGSVSKIHPFIQKHNNISLKLHEVVAATDTDSIVIRPL